MILVYGGDGYIGKHICQILKNNNIQYVLSKSRIYNYANILDDILVYKPTHIISSAGFSTPTNIDFYESNKSELMLTNTTGTLILAHLTYINNIHLTLIMSGCIYNHVQNDTLKFYTEHDMPNFAKSFYSLNRINTENMLSIYKHICILRLRMPISYELDRKSLITKLINYQNVINIPNSVSILEDVLPFIPIVLEKKLIGKFNLVNSGFITHPHILKLYKKYVNPKYTYSICSEQEQNKKLLVKRSNCCLSNKKVRKFMDVPDANSTIYNIMKELNYIKEKYNIF